MKRGLLIVVGLALLAATGYLWTPDTDAEAMVEKYGGPGARFARGPAGIALHFRDEGRRDGPVIVLVHGSSASLQTWDPIVARLQDSFRLIRYDQPGHGLTGPHPDDDYSAASMGEALRALMDHLEVSRFVLVGSSMGGWVSWRFAAKHPQRIAGLVLVAASGAPVAAEHELVRPIGFRLQQYAPMRVVMQHVTPRSLVARTLRGTITRQEIIDDAMIDRYWELLRYPGNRRATAIRAVSSREPERAADLEQIVAPTLIIWGRTDTIVPVQSVPVFEARIAGSESVIYEEAGHIPQEETPDRTAADIRRFASKVWASAAMGTGTATTASPKPPLRGNPAR